MKASCSSETSAGQPPGALAFFAALWITAAPVVAATDGASVWQIGVVLGCLVTLGAVVARISPVRRRKMPPLAGQLHRDIRSCSAWDADPGQALDSGWWLPLLLPALALPLVISAFWWIAAPTIEGRAVLDHIAGFKQYLSITERERLDRMTPAPPPDTPEIFEKYLPYAIALGVENHWADRFQSVLAAAAAQGQQGFAWYPGSSSPWSNPGSFAESVGSSLASTISSASTAPGSSSGSGGGGSSGGGGGGGGGGGW